MDHGLSSHFGSWIGMLLIAIVLTIIACLLRYKDSVNTIPYGFKHSSRKAMKDLYFTPLAAFIIFCILIMLSL